MPTFRVNTPPDNLSTLNAVEITAWSDGILKERYVVCDGKEIDQLIKNLISARNKVWPWPPLQLEVNNP